MNEEAVDAPAQQAEEASGTGSRPTRRRRRRRSGAPKTGASSSSKGSGSSGGQAQKPRAQGTNSPGKGEAEKSTSSSATRRRRRRRSGGGASAQKAPQKAPQKAAQKAAPKEGQAKRSGGRKRSGAKKSATQPSPAAKKPAAKDQEGTPEGASTTRRRRRSRGRGRPGTKPADRRSEKPADKPVAAERTRTRSRKGGGRRRPEEIKVERRTGKLMLITENGDRDQIAVVEDRDLVEHYVTRKGAGSMVGNIYLGKVQNVLPGMEAAFIDIGRGRNAVLYAGEVSYDEDVEGQERRIERALKSGQSVLVQVTKDPIGGKGARLTGQVSLPGRYLVYVPDGGASGISRRLPEKERERLRDIIKRIRPKKAGIIVRTAAEGASEEALEEDLERLKKNWESIRRKSKRGRAPRPLYEEPELTVRVVRDVFSPGEFEKIVTDSKPIYERVVAYLEDIAPDLVNMVELHAGKLSAFDEYHVTEQIHKALERKAWLASGGYLIIDRSEAMTIIDVNTGKHVGKSNLEQTVTQTNLEAAKEIARQLRLRDIGGIIVIDFIDMLLEQNRDLVINTLKEELAHDRTRSQVFEITPLGLLEMTRKRVSAGLVEAFSETCPTCEGRGILLTHEI